MRISKSLEQEEIQIINDNLKAEILELTKKYKICEEKLAHSLEQEKLRGTSRSTTSESQEKQRLSTALLELRHLKEELQKTSEHCQNYKSISENTENELRNMNNIYDEYKASVEFKLKELSDRIYLLNNENELLGSKINAYELKLTTKSDECAIALGKLSEATQQISVLEIDLSDQKKKFRHDIANQEKETLFAHESYQKELMLHAEDIKALESMKADLTARLLELANYKNENIKIQEKLKESNALIIEDKKNYQSLKLQYIFFKFT